MKKLLLILILSVVCMAEAPLYIILWDRIAQCEYGESYSFDTNKCEDINLTLNPDWKEFWGTEK